MPYTREDARDLGFGSIVGGCRPCANCESEPVEDKYGIDGDAIYCSPECRAEDEGDDE